MNQRRLDTAAVLAALGLGPALPTPHGMALATIGGRAVSVATSVSAATVELARRRGTPLVLVASGPVDAGALVWGPRPWPVVAVTDAPALARAAEFGVLVGIDGPCDHVCPDEASAAALVARFLDLAFDDARRIAVDSPGAAPSLLDVVPFAIDEPYDVREVLAAVLDDGRWVAFDDAAIRAGAEVLTAIGRIGGRSVAVAASQPTVGQGVLSPAGLAKIERLVRCCTGAGRPLVTFVDTNGCAAPSDVDELSALRHTATTMRAAPVLKLAVVLGRAVGLGATALGAVGARADAVLPWPRARFALSALDGSADHDAAAAVRRAAREADVRDIIHPDDTRARLIELLDVLRGPREYAS